VERGERVESLVRHSTDDGPDSEDIENSSDDDYFEEKNSYNTPSSLPLGYKAYSAGVCGYCGHCSCYVACVARYCQMGSSRLDCRTMKDCRAFI
jgi:hypothetical protein